MNEAKKESIWTISNGLSMLRGVLILPVAYALWTRNAPMTFALAVLAYLTDILDGYLARRLNQITEAGKIIDPIADKMLVGVSAVILAMQERLPLWFFALVLARDILILSVGIYAAKRLGMVLPSNYTGKVAVVSIAATLIAAVAEADALVISTLIALSSALMIASLTVYGLRLRKELRAVA